MTYPLLALAALAIAALTYASARATGRYLAVTIAGTGALMFLHGARYLRYTSDDAYISYRYAHNLAGGEGLVWNPGEAVEGYSNFLWVMALAAFDLLGADLVWAGRWLGFTLAIAAGAAAYLLVQEVAGRGVLARYAGVTAALALAASGPFALWSYAGLETSLFALLVTGAAILHIREERAETPPISGAVWALAAMTRPDGVLLFAVSACFKAGGLLIAVDGEDDTDVRRARFRNAALWAGGFAALFVPYFAWRYAYYGWPFPNSYYAKVGSGIDQYRRGLRYLVEFSQQYAAWLILLAPIAVVFRAVQRSAGIYILAMLAAWGAYIVYVGGDGLLRFRFFAEVLPLLYALIAASVAGLLTLVRVDDERVDTLRLAAGGIVAAGLLAFMLQATPSEPYAVGVRGEREAVRERAEIGRWLRANAQDDASIALMAAGAIPFESQLVTIDMLGINDEYIGHRPVNVGSRLAAAGHEKYDSQYVLARQPDAVILFDALEPRPFGREDYDRLRFALTPAAADMVTNPRLWRDYEERSVEVRAGAFFSLLVRRDSPLLALTQPAP